MTSLLAKLRRHQLFLLILTAALFFRFYNFSAWQGFDYDQEINAWLAKSIIIDHKPILIGPETSVGAMYVGPYFNYVIALFFAIGKMNPVSTIVLNIIISAATITTLYLAGKDLFSQKVGIIAGTIYAFSSFITNYDRVLWNPTPIPLISVITTWFTVRYLRRWSLVDLFVSAIAAAFSLQLHFQGILLIGFFVVSLSVIGRKKILKFTSLSIIIVIFSLSLLPLLMFDLRHSFLNGNHLLQFLFQGHGESRKLSFNSLLTVPSILGELSYAIFIPDWVLPRTLYIVFFIFVAVLSVIKGLLKNILPYKLFLIMFGFTMLLSFYSGPLPPYYFHFIIPVIILVTADLIVYSFKRAKWLKYLLIILLATFILRNTLSIIAYHSDLSLRNKQGAVKYIISDSGGQTFKVDFVTDPGLNTGFRYLFWQQGTNLVTDMNVPTAKKYKIIIPPSRAKPEEIAVTFGSIGVVK